MSSMREEVSKMVVKPVEVQVPACREHGGRTEIKFFDTNTSTLHVDERGQRVWVTRGGAIIKECTKVVSRQLVRKNKLLSDEHAVEGVIKAGLTHELPYDLLVSARIA